MSAVLTPRQRTRSTAVLHVVSGFITASTIASVGLVTGWVAQTTQAQAAAKAKAKAAKTAASRPASAPAKTVSVPRPSKTVTEVKTTAQPGGGTVRRSSTRRTSTGSSTRPRTRTTTPTRTSTPTRASSPTRRPAPAPRTPAPSTGS